MTTASNIPTPPIPEAHWHIFDYEEYYEGYPRYHYDWDDPNIKYFWND